MDEQFTTVALSRQRGLSRELDTIANNIANASTPGFRREGNVFAEFVRSLGSGNSLSLADLNGRFIDQRSGPTALTSRPLDLSISGEGYFLLQRGDQRVLTRAGAFQISPTGEIVSPQGEALLDLAGSPITVARDGGDISIAEDGTISGSDGPVAQIAVVRPPDIASLRAHGATLSAGDAAEPVETPRIRQGALEGSNVDPVKEIARLIDVTRSYERVQSMIRDDDERVRNVLETLGRSN